MKTIPIFFTFDNNYSIPAAVAFYSLLSNAQRGIHYEMFVLHRDISTKNQSLLEEVVAKFGNATLKFIETGNFLVDNWRDGNWDGQQNGTSFTVDTLIRCFAARFFPSLDKIIYSDVDVVFAQDISELWNVDVENVYVAGVRNAFMKSNPQELSHLSRENYEMLKDSYLAGGIWVMNLKNIRRDDIESKMMAVIKDDTIIKRFNDQDVLNIACGGKVAFLPLNYISYPYLMEWICKESFISHYTRDELYDSIIHPKIIHYATVKPWNGLPGHVRRQEIWWAIHNYLQLGLKEPKSTGKIINRLNRKCRRLWFGIAALAALNIGLICWLWA